ncbi:MAG: hypothetical protein GY751_17155 [Bacteroidetes bacterium]|nr:hypothetical protein [Bacteroidota bacterium]
MNDRLHIDPQVKDAIKIAKDVGRFILSLWYILVILVVLALILGRVKKKPSTVAYVAELTFTINQLATSNNDQSSDVASLITDFGLSGQSSGVNAKRLIELSNSNTVLSEVLFRLTEVDGDTNYLANHFLNLYRPAITDSNFFMDYVGLDSLSRGENSVLNGIIHTVRTKNVLFTISPAEIFKLTTQSKSEEFSKILAEAYYTALSDLYVKGAVTKAQSTYEFTEKRLEETTKNLLSAEGALANWQDRNRNLVYKSAYLTQIDLERKVQIYNAVYMESLRSFESAKVNLENQRPIFQMIDPPRYPLRRVVYSGSSIYVFTVIGAIALFLFIAITLYFYRKYGYLLKELFEE